MSIKPICESNKEEALVAPIGSALVLSNFPNEIAEKIIFYLGKQDLATLSLVSKGYRQQVKAIEGSRIERDLVKIKEMLVHFHVSIPEALLEILEESRQLQDQWGIREWLKYRRIIRLSLDALRSTQLETLCSTVRLQSECLRYQPLLSWSRITYLSDDKQGCIIQRLITARQIKAALPVAIRILDRENRNRAFRSVVTAAMNLPGGIEGMLALVHSTVTEPYHISAMYKVIARVLLENKLYREIGDSLLVKQAIEEALTMDRPDDILQSLVQGWVDISWEERAVLAAIKIQDEKQRHEAVDSCFKSLLDRKALPDMIQLLQTRLQVDHAAIHTHCCINLIPALIQIQEFSYAIRVVQSMETRSYYYPSQSSHDQICQYLLNQLILAKEMTLGMHLVTDYASKHPNRDFTDDITASWVRFLAEERQYDLAIPLVHQCMRPYSWKRNETIITLIHSLVENKTFQQAMVLAEMLLYTEREHALAYIKSARETEPSHIFHE